MFSWKRLATWEIENEIVVCVKMVSNFGVREMDETGTR